MGNTVRAFSLGLQLVLMSSISQASLMTWFTYLFRSLPSLIFLSTYSVLIYFWAQVYQAATLVSTPLLRPTFIFVNIAVYCIYAVITVLTLLLHAYEEYRTYSIFLIGVIYLAVSVGFFVYGMKVSGQLSDRSRQLHRKNFIIRRVMALSVACPIIFSLRGFYCLAFSFGFISKYYPQGISRFIWDAIIYMTSEWVPSLLMLFFFWPRRSHQLPPRVENSDVSAPLVRSNYPQAGARASQPLPAPSAARTVSGQLSDRSRQLHRKNFIIRRVMALSVACPIIFSLRGFYCLAFSFGFISKYYPQGISRFIWDAIIYMTSEWVPSLLMLFFFWPRRSHQLPPRVENSDVSAPLVRSNYPQAGARASQPLPAPSAARTVRQPRATYDGRMGDYQPLPQQQAYGGGVGRHGDMAGGAPHIDVWDRAKDGGTHVVPAEAALRPAADDGETPKPKGHR
ncbi:unnamed protein product [Vitrella brassicaformis CCMP3155]|uniref:THH1/TOM1/TOM3 domain-containing protein n=1 Tax=Vitrella brassicaformis (strain CCMP3155) TaxID=1169540 RepID=A0A0G4ERU1_VITBC|nr:unnamed protein product [Vitrella brassicaformis CCMP3155]|eukprot:CEM00769.1 unnamed protein product [Vitrella brassicaformis CCMP3155]